MSLELSLSRHSRWVRYQLPTIDHLHMLVKCLPTKATAISCCALFYALYTTCYQLYRVARLSNGVKYFLSIHYNEMRKIQILILMIIVNYYQSRRVVLKFNNWYEWVCARHCFISSTLFYNIQTIVIIYYQTFYLWYHTTIF